VARIENFTINVADSELAIDFVRFDNIENPKICAIEIIPVTQATPSPSPPTSFTPLYINAGATDYTDSQNKKWVKDAPFVNTGNIFDAPGTTDILSTTEDGLFRSERWDASTGEELKYSIPIPNGQYQIKLYFAETWVKTVGGRVFDVKVEGVTVLNDYDIYSQAGAFNTAVIETVTTTVSDSMLTIEFIHGVQNPKVCAISVTSTDVVSPAPTTAPVATSPPLHRRPPLHRHLSIPS
jgi:hypothetical protein